jgi:hypothetical protein
MSYKLLRLTKGELNNSAVQISAAMRFDLPREGDINRQSSLQLFFKLQCGTKPVTRWRLE